MKKVLVVVGMLLLCALAFSKGKIGVTYVKSPLNVPSIVEREKGIFQKAFEKWGLEVEYSTLTAGPDQTNALASGDIQFLHAVGATSVILAAANGLDIKIIDVYSRAPGAYMLFSKTKIPTDAASLKGKKVAGPKGTILHELLLAFLAKNGLKESDVEFIKMDIPNAKAALDNGSIDIALLAGPAAYNAELAGNYIVATGEGLIDPVIVSATSEKYLKSNPEVVEAFLQARKDILAYMAENYDDVIALSAKETDLDKEAVLKMYPLYDFDNTIRDSDVSAMEKTMDFMLQNGMIEKKVDIKSLILTK